MAWGKGTWGATGAWGGLVTYTTTFDPANLPNGIWQLSIIATDNSSDHNITTFGPIILDVELPGPPPPPPSVVDPLSAFDVPYRTDVRGVAIIAPDPADGAVSGDVDVVVLLTSDEYGRPITHAELLVDGTSAGPMIKAYGNWSTRWHTPDIANGLRALGLLTINDASRQVSRPALMSILVANGA